MVGFMKFTKPKEELAEKMAWVKDFDGNMIKLIGLLEVLGAVGIIFPVLLNIMPFLTPLAATGLLVTMIGAVLTHLRRNEIPMIVPNLVLGGLATFVLWQTVGLLGL